MKTNISQIIFAFVFFFALGVGFSADSIDSKDFSADSHIDLESSKTTQPPKPLDSPKRNPPSTSKRVEVYVGEGTLFPLKETDAEIRMFGDRYAILPLSSELKAFLRGQTSPVGFRTLSADKSTVEIQNDGKNILFYYAGRGSSRLYEKVAPKRFALIKEEFSDEDSEPLEIQEIYVIKDYDESILHSSCQIAQNKQFIRDRARSEIMINLDNQINARIATVGRIEFALICEMPQKNEGFFISKNIK